MIQRLLTAGLPRSPRVRQTGVLLILLAAGCWAYWTSLPGVFLLDDETNILEYSRIHTLAWPWTFLAGVRRPVLYLSLAVNYAVGGEDPFSYHVFNLFVHVLAAFCLYLLVARTAAAWAARRQRGEVAAGGLALSAALLWLLHPLQTQSVTYVVQRAESLMGLFFLVSLWAAGHYFARPGRTWLVISVVAGLLSGLTKEVAVVLPLVVLLYDQTFISATWRQAWSRHRALYGGLAVIWLVMGYLYLVTPPETIPTAGFAYKGITPWRYLLSQPGVILYYLRLALWPSPLVFDYQWPAVSGPAAALPALVPVLSVLAAALLGFRRYPVAAFLTLSFFLILAPSSSVIPLKDLAFEHRMYLPLACVLIGAVLAGQWALARWPPWPGIRRGVAALLVIVIAGVYGGLTYHRNLVYHSSLGMWQDVVTRRPDNARANNNYGRFLYDNGRAEEAMYYYRRAIRLNPDYADAYLNLGSGYVDHGDFPAGIAYTQRAIELNPYDGVAYNNMGAALANLEKFTDAIPYYEQALNLGFIRPGVYHNLGLAYAKTGRPRRAIRCMQETLRLDPDYPQARAHLGEIQRRLNQETDPDQFLRGVAQALRQGDAEQIASCFVDTDLNRAALTRMNAEQRGQLAGWLDQARLIEVRGGARIYRYYYDCRQAEPCYMEMALAQDDQGRWRISNW